jgi:hypothetical protein
MAMMMEAVKPERQVNKKRAALLVTGAYFDAALGNKLFRCSNYTRTVVGQWPVSFIRPI